MVIDQQNSPSLLQLPNVPEGHQCGRMHGHGFEVILHANEELNDAELNDLEKLLLLEDEILYKWYFEKNVHQKIPKTKVSALLQNFKL